METITFAGKLSKPDLPAVETSEQLKLSLLNSDYFNHFAHQIVLFQSTLQCITLNLTSQSSKIQIGWFKIRTNF